MLNVETRASHSASRGLKLRVRTRDGMKLAATVFGGDAESPVGTLVIAGAVGVAQPRYAELAAFFAELGWVAVTFDYRGIGASTLAKPAYEAATMQEWAEQDLDGVLGWVQATYPAPRRAALGHSIGGQLLGLTEAHRSLDAAALIASQKGYWALWPGWRCYGLRAFWWLMPFVVRALGRLPLSRVGLDDLPPRVALDWARWGVHDDYLDEGHRSQLTRFASVRTPLLALSLEDDRTYAPRPSVARLLSRYYRNAPALHCHVEPERYGLARVGHSGFFAQNQVPRQWWRELAAWLLTASARDLHAGLSPTDGNSLSRALVATL